MAYYLFFLMAYNTAHSMLAVSVLIFFCFLFFPPPKKNAKERRRFFDRTFFIQYTSLTPEISKDYNERTQLTVFRFGISMAATLVYTFLHAYLIEAFDDPDNPGSSLFSCLLLSDDLFS